MALKRQDRSRGHDGGFNTGLQLSIGRKLVVPVLFVSLMSLSNSYAQSYGASITGPVVPRSFDTVSIRPSQQEGPSIIQPLHNGIRAQNVTVEDLVRDAFWTVASQSGRVLGLPDWAFRNKYDIVAKIAADSSDLLATDETAQGLLRQQLLIDRFHFKYHYETKEVAAFQLVVARGGVKMKPGAPSADMPTGTLRAKPGSIVAEGIQIGRLVTYLMQIQDRPVVDKTGLIGSYSFSLEWQVDEDAQIAGPDDIPKETTGVLGANSLLPVALREQLGLRLVGTRAPVKVVVVDHIERPTGN